MTDKHEAKEKITPKMIKGMANLPSDEQDYGVLFYFAQNDFKTFEECKEHWENEDIEVFATALTSVMKQIQPKLDKFNNLNDKLNAE